MLAGEFARKLNKVNKRLHVFCGNDDSRPAGVYYYDGWNDYIDICGVSKNYVPEFSQFAPNGAILSGGWRRVLKILIQRKLVDRRIAERVFNVHLEYGELPKRQLEQDRILKAIADARQRGIEESARKYGKPVDGYMKLDDIIDIHRSKPDYQKKLGEKLYV